MEQGSACVNIGNGDVCIRVGDISNNRADVTVWFSRKAGDPVLVRLAWFPGPRYDEGGFRISAGEVRGYIWRNQLLYDYSCLTGAILMDPPNWARLHQGRNGLPTARPTEGSPGAHFRDPSVPVSRMLTTAKRSWP